MLYCGAKVDGGFIKGAFIPCADAQVEPGYCEPRGQRACASVGFLRFDSLVQGHEHIAEIVPGVSIAGCMPQRLHDEPDRLYTFAVMEFQQPVEVQGIGIVGPLHEYRPIGSLCLGPPTRLMISDRVG